KTKGRIERMVPSLVWIKRRSGRRVSARPLARRSAHGAAEPGFRERRGFRPRTSDFRPRKSPTRPMKGAVAPTLEATAFRPGLLGRLGRRLLLLDHLDAELPVAIEEDLALGRRVTARRVFHARRLDQV